MRNPFRLKNSIEDGRQAEDVDLPLDFEESLLPASGEKLESDQDGRPNLRIFWLLNFLIFAVIFGRLYFLAVTKHDYFREIADGNRLRIEYLLAPRGAIYDQNGTLVAGSRPSFELVASPLDLPKDEDIYQQVVSRVAEIIAMPLDEIKRIIESSDHQIFQSVAVKQNLAREQALILHEQSNDLPGFRVVNTPIRDYRSSLAYSHLLGYVGKISPEEYKEKRQSGYLYNDTIGKTGLEQVYEGYLRGSFGERQVEVDARGVVKKVFGEKQAEAGNKLMLNIDAKLQEKLYQALMRQTGDKKSAAGIVMNPQNGRILALISLPGFNNNLFAEGISAAEYQKFIQDKREPLFNRSISGTYPPGSTVKPLVAAAALQEAIVSEKTYIEDRGYILIKNIYGGPDYFFYGYNRKGLGSMNVRSAIALSSDIYFYIVGGGYEPAGIEGLGISKLADHYRKFKIDETLGIDLPGEKPGLIPTPSWKVRAFESDPVASQWYLGNTYHVSIGQGDLLATPLHVLSWTSAIANGGRIHKPFIVDRIEDQDGRAIEKYEPEIIGELAIDEKYLKIVREGMRQTVTDGTAKSLNSLSVATAGKTGTAQFDARNLYRTHAWFVGFAPADEPEIAIVVLIEDGGEGSANAVPVAREVLDWWAKERYNKQGN